jgi:phosphate transport system protein
MMRKIYHDELDEVGVTLIEMSKMVGVAMQRATSALLDGDLAGA